MKSHVIENTTPLEESDAYTSGTRDMYLVFVDFGIAVSHFVVEVDSDQAGTVEVEQSTDQVIWEVSQDATDYVADSGVLRLSVQPSQPPVRYVRAVFTNGDVAQTRFNMVTGVDYQ